ncbi:hypothetical protein EDB80DRAFT_305814 [Ilyonectria destructans]|nr:hypothetical protein EDB80DRAFT_305814 [Ilyonectria destructans]
MGFTSVGLAARVAIVIIIILCQSLRGLTTGVVACCWTRRPKSGHTGRRLRCALRQYMGLGVFGSVVAGEEEPLTRYQEPPREKTTGDRPPYLSHAGTQCPRLTPSTE